MTARVGPRTVRSDARVVRISGEMAFVVFTKWRNAQILVTVPCGVLQQALGLSRCHLLGAQASAIIDPDAVLDAQVMPFTLKPAGGAGAEEPSAPPQRPRPRADGRHTAGPHPLRRDHREQ